MATTVMATTATLAAETAMGATAETIPGNDERLRTYEKVPPRWAEGLFVSFFL
jgi:hypothetical protein